MSSKIDKACRAAKEAESSENQQNYKDAIKFNREAEKLYKECCEGQDPNSQKSYEALSKMHKRQARLLELRQDNALPDANQVLAKFAPKPKTSQQEFEVRHVYEKQHF